MNMPVISLLFMLALCGCSSPQPTARIPSDTPSVVFTDCRRARDSAFSQREQDIIAAARRHLEQSDKRPIDAYYRVKHTTTGFEVFVIYVSGYRDGQPFFMP